MRIGPTLVAIACLSFFRCKQLMTGNLRCRISRTQVARIHLGILGCLLFLTASCGGSLFDEFCERPFAAKNSPLCESRSNQPASPPLPEPANRSPAPAEGGFDANQLRMTNWISNRSDGTSSYLVVDCPNRGGCTDEDGDSYQPSDVYGSIFDSESEIKDEYTSLTTFSTVNILINYREGNDNREGWTIREIAAIGQHAALYSQAISGCPENCGNMDNVLATAIGRYSTNMPSRSATWRGAMIGTELRSRAALVGESLVIYEFGESDSIDVRLFNIRKRDDSIQGFSAAYEGPSEIKWEDVPVDNDGSFSSSVRPSADVISAMEGDFYGPNGQEVAGIFEYADGSDGGTVLDGYKHVTGAWLAR